MVQPSPHNPLRRQVLIARRTDLDRLQEPGVVPSQLLNEIRLDQDVSDDVLRTPYVLMEWETLCFQILQEQSIRSIDRFVQLMADRDVVLLHVNRESGDLSGYLHEESKLRDAVHKQCDHDRVMGSTWWHIQVFTGEITHEELELLDQHVKSRDQTERLVQEDDADASPEELSLETVGQIGAAYVLSPWLTQSKDGARLYSEFVWPVMAGRLLQFLASVDQAYAQGELRDNQQLKAWRCVEISPQVDLTMLKREFTRQLEAHFKPMSDEEGKWDELIEAELAEMKRSALPWPESNEDSAQTPKVRFNLPEHNANRRLVAKQFPEDRLDRERSLAATYSHTELTRREQKSQHRTGSVEKLSWGEIATFGPSGISYLQSRAVSKASVEDLTQRQIADIQSYKSEVKQVELLRDEIVSRAKTLDEVNSQMVSISGRILAVGMSTLLMFYISYMIVDPVLGGILPSYSGLWMLFFGLLGSISFYLRCYTVEFDHGSGYERALQQAISSLEQKHRSLASRIQRLIETSQGIGQRQSAIETEQAIVKLAKRTWSLITSTLGPVGISQRVEGGPIFGSQPVPTTKDIQSVKYHEQTTVDTLSSSEREREQALRDLAIRVDWDDAPYRLSNQWNELISDLDPKQRGQIPKHEFTRRWKLIVRQMNVDFLDQLLQHLHFNNKVRDRRVMLNEACDKFSRDFDSKQTLTNLSVRLKLNRGSELIDYQRVVHVRPTERNAEPFELAARSRLGVKIHTSSVAPFTELFVEEVPFGIKDLIPDAVPGRKALAVKVDN